MSEYAKLKWRCRRGTRELDVILLRWLDTRYTSAEESELELFVQVLALEDPTLFAYVTGREKPQDPAIEQFILNLRADSSA